MASGPLRPDILGIFMLGLLFGCQFQWFQLIGLVVPEPYLDEVFHVPQAQQYWSGNWRSWDPKITTPPGVYIWSYGLNTLTKTISGGDDEIRNELSTDDLRRSNVVLFFVMSMVLGIWTAISRPNLSQVRSIGFRRELCLVAFPLFFFFGGLYYTDLFSAVTVVLTYICWQTGINFDGSLKLLFQTLHLFCGLLSLATRQTNIFWVAVFLGGLQVIESIKQDTRVHDPPVADAYFEDFPTMIISLTASAFSILPSLLLNLWPQLILLASFAGFVAWNGGVVLGDKSNHVATIHLPQLLYIWPFLIFFSWPVLLPYLTNLSALRNRLPRLWIIGVLLAVGTITVHFNTIIHPFTLADNRHYTFYVFKIIRARWWIKYALVPAYVACGWLAILALGKPTQSSPGTQRARRASDGGQSTRLRKLSSSSGKGDVASEEEAGTVRISFILVWLISTALSLITAPLVEPRYFIVPWLVWRLHVPEMVAQKSTHTNTGTTSFLRSLLRVLSSYSLWVEFVWYMMINFATCWMFLYRGFAWAQEPGKVQRFMW